ncbi:MAG: hypothetical protein B7733_22975 [Myxococcales bacterium FL481]|nr:MAG: hypothetical protein B7733_22975 [Myxococcales bacterium FL481]
MPDETKEWTRYKSGDPIHLRAQQGWVVLIGHAKCKKRVLTYGDLADLMGWGREAARATIRPLAILAKFCLDHGLPQLNAIVVNQSTQVPGHGVILKDGQALADAQQEVYDFDWYTLRVPGPGILRRVWEEWE